MTLILSVPYSYGQEFNCEVTINDRQISSSSVDHAGDLAQELERYINEHRWTGQRYEPHERIGCRLQVILRDVDNMMNFEAELILGMRRPIYNSMQESQVLLLSDETWQFNYQRGRSLIRDHLQFDDLTSVIDFYVYVMLGYDHDSFSELGGTDWFRRARDIQEIAETTGAAGWSRSISNRRNRHGLISDLSNASYRELRRATYHYYRWGLDQFTTDEAQAREAVMEAIERIADQRRQTSGEYLFDLFFDTKYSELVALFRDAPAGDRLQAYNLLRSVDPGHSGEYERLRN